jgi:hypothetical protein
MTGTSNPQFGLMIAYVLPGFIGLAGLAPLFPAIGRWLRPIGQGDLGLGPPLYAVLGATTVGLVLSCFRWLLVDRLHRKMGVRRPAWDDRQLDDVLGGFDYLVQNHFRYYEFCGNTLLALLGAYGLNRSLGTLPFLGLATDLAMAVVAIVLFTASRDALTNYYTRTGRLIGQLADNPIGDQPMFNGNDHTGGSTGSNSQQHPVPQPQPKQDSTDSPKVSDAKGTSPRK